MYCNVLCQLLGKFQQHSRRSSIMSFKCMWSNPNSQISRPSGQCTPTHLQVPPTNLSLRATSWSCLWLLWWNCLVISWPVSFGPSSLLACPIIYHTVMFIDYPSHILAYFQHKNDLCISEHQVCHCLWFHHIQSELKLMLGHTLEYTLLLFDVAELVFPT